MGSNVPPTNMEEKVPGCNSCGLSGQLFVDLEDLFDTYQCKSAEHWHQERPLEGAIKLKRLPHADVLIWTDECSDIHQRPHKATLLQWTMRDMCWPSSIQ